MTTLQAGHRYRLRYRLDSMRRDRVCVATYLGDRYDGDYEFNMRPAAGTASLPPSSIVSFEKVDDSVPHSQPKIANG